MNKLIIEKNLLKKIKEWCSQLPNKEWSGTLYYKVVEESDNNLILRAIDMFISDVGTSTFTSFEQSVEEIAYQDDNDLLDCFEGLIHSHNTMAKRISF